MHSTPHTHHDHDHGLAAAGDGCGAAFRVRSERIPRGLVHPPNATRVRMTFADGHRVERRVPLRDEQAAIDAMLFEQDASHGIPLVTSTRPAYIATAFDDTLPAAETDLGDLTSHMPGTMLPPGGFASLDTTAADPSIGTLTRIGISIYCLSAGLVLATAAAVFGWV